VQGFSGSLSLAWTRATFDGGDNDGKQINGVPERLAFARASYEHAAHGSFTLEVQHVSRQWVNEDNSTPLPDYTVANLGVTQAAGPVELFGSVRNVTDKKHATLGYVVLAPVYFPAAGRSFMGGMRLRFGM
jgi:outer membrane receptor protein involved in Fe transport